MCWDVRQRCLTPLCIHVCRYVDEDGVVTLKGRVAATIQSADELVMTELIFNSGFKVKPPVRSSCHPSTGKVDRSKT